VFIRCYGLLGRDDTADGLSFLMHRPDSCNLFRGTRIYPEYAPKSRKPMKSLLIIAVLCLSLILMSGITPASRTSVFRPGALATPAASPAAPTSAASRKGVSGGQARWLRVVPGLFR
jgi:hypothetical protein